MFSDITVYNLNAIYKVDLTLLTVYEIMDIWKVFGIWDMLGAEEVYRI